MKHKGDLILTKDLILEEDLIVDGNIICKDGIWDIKALDIKARDIKARDIDAMDIDAMDIICEKRIKKDKSNKTICRVFVKNKSKVKREDKI